MKKHLLYLKYVLLHKWYVFVVGRKLNVPWMRLLLHDLSKFLPDEWFPYVDYFHHERTEAVALMFAKACKKHKAINDHHWEYWVSPATYIALPMPEKCIREMLADWCSVGYVLNGRYTIWEYYEAHKENMRLHKDTRKRIEELLPLLRNTLK